MEAPSGSQFLRGVLPDGAFYIGRGKTNMDNKVKRFLGDKDSEYVVVGLMMMKPGIDSFSGSITYELTCRLGDVNQPVDFLPFFEQTQRERQYH